MKLLSQRDPKRPTITLALALDEILTNQFLDVVLGTGSAQIHQVRLQDALFQGDRGQCSQSSC